MTCVPTPEEREDGQDPAVLVPVLAQPQLGEDAADVGLDGLEFHAESMPDRQVRPTFGHQHQDLQLAWREPVDPVVPRSSTEREAGVAGGA